MGNGNKGAATTIVAVLVSLAVAGIGGYMVGQRSGQQSAQLEAQAVATVNNSKITKADLYDRMVKTEGLTTLNRMIEEKLVENAAKEANVSVTKADIDAEVKKIKDRIGGEEAFKNALTQYNMTMEQLEQEIVFRMSATKILSKNIPVDDAALQQYFSDNRSQFDKREVHARHILVASEAEAKAIKAELDKGADFATLAKAKSTEPSAKQTGGDLGTFTPGKMVPEFDAVVFNMKKNEISAPFQSQFGWHVAQVLDIKGAMPTFEQVKADVKEMYTQEQVSAKLEAWLEELKTKAKVTNTLEPKK